jgi:putative ABC transport system ATP-binding protein
MNAQAGMTLAGADPRPRLGGPGGLVLELEAATKVYPSRPPVTALAGVSLAVAAGELVAVLGPSGSGKTTLLHLAGTLDKPTTGTVRVVGLDVAALSDRGLAGLRAGRVGFIFQQFFLAEHQSVLGNVADGLLYAGYGLAERKERAAAVLRLVGLGDRLGARPTQLSGGQRQRVAIARALAGSPELVLADEPTGNLDQATGAAILDLLEDLNAQGVTIIVVTHDHAVAARARRQVEMLDGRIVADTGIGTGRPAGALAPGLAAGPARARNEKAGGRPAPQPSRLPGQEGTR